MPTLQELEKKKQQLIQQFADSSIVSNPGRLKALSLEYAMLQGQIKALGETNEKEPSKLIMEIRAGTGGEEAALFAAQLLSMYQRFCERRGWKFVVFDELKTDLGGIKSITLEIQGKEAWALLKNEAGTHRVQRIPQTEKSGRIHTSTATVAILPMVEHSVIELREEDLLFDTAKSSGPGGQNVNKRMTAVRITHKPTGIVVSSQVERSLDQNRQRALALLKTKLAALEQEKKLQEITKERRDQIGVGKRAEKIRTYNFPQNRLTDHRLGKSWHNLNQILGGELYEIVTECLKIG